MKKALLMLSVISMLIVASCKKETPKEDETKETCQMTSATVKSSYNGNQSSYTDSHTYDEKGRITKVKDTYGYETNYSYSNTQIIEESPLHDGSYSKSIYQLDASGKIVSAAMQYTYNGNNEIYSLKYFYNSDGYLSETQDTYDSGPNAYTTFYKYNYTNGNLTSNVRTSNNPNSSGPKTIVIAYTNDLAPSSFFYNYDEDMPNTGILKAYFGKTSKNLISTIGLYQSYTYQKNAEGNVSQMIETSSSSTDTYGYTYNCK